MHMDVQKKLLNNISRFTPGEVYSKAEKVGLLHVFHFHVEFYNFPPQNLQ